MSLDGQGAANRVSRVVGKNSPLDLLSDPHRRLRQSEARLRADEGLAYGLNCSPCDRLVRSPDVAPLRGSITEEEATETPHPTRSLSCLHSSGLNPAPQVDLGPIGGALLVWICVEGRGFDSLRAKEELDKWADLAEYLQKRPQK